MTIEELKQILLDKGLIYADIEFEPEQEVSLYVRIWFKFRWTNRDQDKLNDGWQEFEGNNEEDILKEIDKFLLDHQTGDWVIDLTSK